MLGVRAEALTPAAPTPGRRDRGRIRYMSTTATRPWPTWTSAPPRSCGRPGRGAQTVRGAAGWTAVQPDVPVHQPGTLRLVGRGGGPRAPPAQSVLHDPQHTTGQPSWRSGWRRTRRSPRADLSISVKLEALHFFDDRGTGLRRMALMVWAPAPLGATPSGRADSPGTSSPSTTLWPADAAGPSGAAGRCRPPVRRAASAPPPPAGPASRCRRRPRCGGDPGGGQNRQDQRRLEGDQRRHRHSVTHGQAVRPGEAAIRAPRSAPPSVELMPLISRLSRIRRRCRAAASRPAAPAADPRLVQQRPGCPRRRALARRARAFSVSAPLT